MVDLNKNYKLLILGNGFHLAHGLNTKFIHFKEYLREKDKELYEWLNEDLDENWGNFEQSINKKYWKCVYEIDKILLKNNYKQEEVPNNVVAAEIVEWDRRPLNNICPIAINEIQQLCWYPEKINQHIRNWLNEQEKARSKQLEKTKKIDFDFFDLVISFNYTTYWKKLYNVEKPIVFIHGNLEDKNNRTGYTIQEKRMKITYRKKNSNQEEIIEFPNDVLNQFNKEKFSKMSEISKKIRSKKVDLYSYGFSFGEEDHKYIVSLCDKTSELNVFIHKYNEGEIEAEIEKIKKQLNDQKFNYKFIDMDNHELTE